jgi:hypothetical protein
MGAPGSEKEKDTHEDRATSEDRTRTITELGASHSLAMQHDYADMKRYIGEIRGFPAHPTRFVTPPPDTRHR